MLFELLRLSWKALWERRGRTIGAIVGVVIAFTALSFSLLLTQTMKEAVAEFFEKNFGLNIVMLVGSLFTDADVASLSSIEGVEAVVPMVAYRGRVRVPGSGEFIAANVYAINPADVPRVIPQAALHDGQLFVGQGFALAGYYIAYDRSTGEQRVGPGSIISLDLEKKAVSLVVAGVLAVGSIGFFSTATGVVIDLSEYRRLTGFEKYNVLVVVARDSSLVDDIISEVRARFPTAEILSPQVILKSINAFLTGFQAFLGLVAGVSTVITALWLYDTMSISVLQRTREIGIMRAVGFKRRHITLMFLGEAFIIAAIGVAIGSVLLVPLSDIDLSTLFNAGPDMSFLPPGTRLIIDPTAVAAAVMVVVAVNLIGALAPAIRASRIRLVEALKYE
ncbi:ABC transporter permease [Pyrobaculum calidifontis]|nr:ABC transporter permease [Pyrobaculum calidifontis]